MALSDKLSFLSEESIAGDEGKGVVAGDGEDVTDFDGSQLNPGLIIKLTVSPCLTAYSCKSFPSAKAFPFNRRR